ncbi:hypothetical protein BG003_011618 [Podila horticola]|nr:hypothetical protein BG003_011618 [Podila horticola]
MPALEHLSMSVMDDYNPIPVTMVPRLSAYTSRHQLLVDIENRPALDPAFRKLRDHWNLPRLKTLDLEDPKLRFRFQVAAKLPSKLTKLYLHGPWVMSELDLNKVLTVYAPNLTTLVVDSIHMTSLTT